MTSSVRKASLTDAEQITALINRAFRRAEGFFIETDRINLKVSRTFSRRDSSFGGEWGLLAACVYVEPRGQRAYLGLFVG